MSVTDQLFDIGIAPPEVRRVPILPEYERGKSYTGMYAYYHRGQIRWSPETDWNDAAYYLGRYKLRVMPWILTWIWIPQPQGTWYIGAESHTLSRDFYEKASTLAEVPAAICRLALRLHQDGVQAVPTPAGQEETPC